ncbi:MAG: lipoyl(octanoyl) transferase LipB [Magnetococcales bacterium]|nr:lipoyl(octanoyl) transferase LipB [Magnetococcales bacterium]MBF0156899.1 lipoyl(octanoyl) transferase LipB [Magnetococcales bacterium]
MVTRIEGGYRLERRRLWPYAEAWEEQKRLALAISRGEAPNTLILTEHPPVYTIGRSGERSEVLRTDLVEGGIEVVETDRGGRVTYHGPGQMVAYVLWHLGRGVPDVRGHVSRLEETVIRSLGSLGLKADRDERGGPGVWIDGAKIAALGVRIRHGVSYHGLGVNHEPDLGHFRGIVPCGLREGRVTSLAALGVTLPRETLEEIFVAHFQEVFGAYPAA